ncbi:armadillo-type protein [Phlyctochytrium arcticum]|nr:armadillo-type protein [Phlyctochytrium arcticum]
MAPTQKKAMAKAATNSKSAKVKAAAPAKKPAKLVQPAVKEEEIQSEGEMDVDEAEEAEEWSEDEDQEDGEDWEEMEDGDEEDEGDEEDDDEEPTEQNGEGPTEKPASKKVKTAEEEEKQRLARAEQKSLQTERKLAKPNATMIQEVKRIWEKLRAKETDAATRHALLDELLVHIKGKVKQICLKHDASRAVQTLLKYGKGEHRRAVTSELKGNYVDLSRSSYGRFLVTKVIQYGGPNDRADIIKDFQGKIRKLVRHREAATVLEEVYLKASSAQQDTLLEEFYGPEYVLYKHGGGKNLNGLFTELPEKKPFIVKHLGGVVHSILSKGFTSIGHLSVVHKAIYDYMTFVDPKQLPDLIELLKDHLVTILHTQDGARVARKCILHAGPKDRKLIVKSLKSFVGKIAREQYGHSVLLALFDCVDDTVLLDKAIISELVTSDAVTADSTFTDVLRHPYASRVVLYLLCGRTKRYNLPIVYTELEAADAIRAETTKKDEAYRRSQLKAIISPPLLKECTERAAELVRDVDAKGVVVETALCADDFAYLHIICALLGDLSAFYGALAQLAAGELPPTSEESDDVKEEGTEGSLKIKKSASKKSEPFHAVKSLKSAAEAAKQERHGIDLSEHVMINRAATRCLKDIISPRKPGNRSTEAVASKPTPSSEPSSAKSPTPSPEARSQEFAVHLSKVLAPNLSYWLNHCVNNPRTTSGTAFIFIAILENGGEEAKKNLLANKPNAAALKKLSKTAEKALASSQAAAAEVKKENGAAENANGKRKRKGGHAAIPAKAKDTAKPAPSSTSGIQILLKLIQENA